MGCLPTTDARCKICGKSTNSIEHYKRLPMLEVLQQIKPLDILLMRTSETSSAIIRTAQLKTIGHGEFSHVGIVVDSSIMPIVEKDGQTYPNKLYFFECTMDDNVKDVISGEMRKGVQVRDLKDYMIGYGKLPGAVISWAKLKDNPLFASPSKLPEIAPKLNEFFKKTIHKDYELSNLHHLLIAIMDGPVKHEPDKTYFCSELVSGVFQACGLFPEYLDIETIAPSELLCNCERIRPKFEDPVVVDLTETPK